jgi:autotransporter-associated beta strand protein
MYSDGSLKGDVFVYGVFDLNSYSETINGLSGNGIVDNSTAGSPVLTIGANNANSTFGGSIKNSVGTLGLIKTGSGEIIFTGNNTYSGPTTVSGGDLRINGSTSSSSTFTVQSGAKISGKGIIGGQVTINDGGEINRVTTRLERYPPAA